VHTPSAIDGRLEFDVLRQQVLLKYCRVLFDERLGVARFYDFHQPGERLDGLSLAEVIPKRG
jgi:hypothetical protein